MGGRVARRYRLYQYGGVWVGNIVSMTGRGSKYEIGFERTVLDFRPNHSSLGACQSAP